MPVFHVIASANEKTLKFGIVAENYEEACQAAESISFEETSDGLVAECDHPTATVYVVSDEESSNMEVEEPPDPVKPSERPIKISNALKRVWTRESADVEEPPDPVKPSERPIKISNALKRVWTRESADALISICTEVDVDGSLSKKHGKCPKWHIVSQKMVESGYPMNPHQCRYKWWKEKDAFRRAQEKGKIKGYKFSGMMKQAMELHASAFDDLSFNWNVSDWPSQVKTPTSDPAGSRLIKSRASPLKNNNDPDKFLWNKDALAALIQVCGELKIDISVYDSLQPANWAEVASKLQARGFKVTANQCCAKWAHEKLAYRKFQAKLNESGNDCLPDIDADDTAQYSALFERTMFARTMKFTNTVYKEMFKINSAMACTMEDLSKSNAKLVAAMEENNKIHARLATAIEKIADSLSHQQQRQSSSQNLPLRRIECQRHVTDTAVPDI